MTGTANKTKLKNTAARCSISRAAGAPTFPSGEPEAGAGESGVFFVHSVLNGFSAFGWGDSPMKIPAYTMQSQ